MRYAYANTPSFPQLKQAPRAAQEPVQVFSQPSLIAKPSVVPGKEHQWHIRYNQHGQPIQITEIGYRPALLNKDKAEATQISRIITYRYQTINGRSLLAQIDGPLPNGNDNTPKDSDITQYHYDRYGQYLTQMIAPGNISTKLAYDLAGTPHADSATTGGTGRVTSTIAHNGIATVFNYSQSGKVLSTQRYPATLSLASAKEAGLLQSTAMRYDVFGNNTMIKRADGQAAYMQYGSDGKLTQLKDALGNRVEWRDWHLGQRKQDESVTTQQWFTADAPDKVARAWYFWRDDQNRLTQRLNPDGGLDTWQYSQGDESVAQQNHWVQHIDPLNHMTLSAMSNQGHAQVRMTSDGYMDAHFSVMADQERVQTASKQSHSQPVQIQDDFGRVIQFSSAQHGTHSADYNAANRIFKIQQPDGTQIHYTYDVAGRLLTKTVTAQQPKQIASVHYTYNLYGLSQIKDSKQTLSYSQDLLGREIDKATSINLKNGLIKTYHIHTRYTVDGKVKAKQLINGDWLVFSLNDTTGLTQAMTLHKTLWPSLTNQLADWLDMPDLPLQIATTKPVVTNVQVHPFNGITHIAHGNGISDDYGFDIAGRLITVSHGKATQNSQQHQPFVNASYKYDAGRRLISERISTAEFKGNVREYAYTGWNTFTTPPQSGFIKAVVSPTSNNNMVAGIPKARLNNADTAATTLDQAGRTTTDQHYRYQYDAWGKLSSVQTKTNNVTITSYQSNALGERIMASYSNANNHQLAQTRYYLYDKQQRIAELDENGDVIQQYLYINQTPVAVINTPTEQTQPSDKQSAEGIIAIHTDRRHAPIAATDEQGKVIWQAEYDAWGKVIPASLREERVNPNQSNQNTFNLALRLPGQWQDQATGLHYNYQRDYNPETGRYLTPDPLGFPDGTDPYAYVNNDPLNKLDPLGLYEIDVHYYMTFFLAVAAGVPAEDARIIALATQHIDDNPDTTPIKVDFDQAYRLSHYHFTQSGHDVAKPPGMSDESYINYRIQQSYSTSFGLNPQLNNLYSASLVVKNDSRAHCRASLQLYGEYLHAFEDTFGHRNQTNEPIDVNAGAGHLFYGHEADKTFSAYVYDSPYLLANGDWGVRPTRTLEMEREVFALFQANFGTKLYDKNGKLVTIKSIENVLNTFNSIHEYNENTNEFSNPATSAKIAVLQVQLDNWGLNVNLRDATKPNFMGYSRNIGENNRNEYLCVNDNLARKHPLDAVLYPGVILPRCGL